MGADATAVRAAADEFYREQRFGEFLLERGVIDRRMLGLALARQAIGRSDYAEAKALIDEMIADIGSNVAGRIAAIRDGSIELARMMRA